MLASTFLKSRYWKFSEELPTILSMTQKKTTTNAIVQNGMPVLRAKAKEVPVKEIVGKNTQALLARMKRVLDAEPHGAALAAPQVGESLRVFILSERVFSGEEERDIAHGREKEEHFVFINPHIIKRSRRKKELDEGCLSVRGFYGKVPRYEKITIEAYDEYGKKFTRGASGLMAQAFQHETDHLDGTLFIDHATELWEEREGL